jgi:hypothetical protein
MSTHSLSETPQFTAFRDWTKNNGGYIHPALTFVSGQYLKVIIRVPECSLWPNRVFPAPYTPGSRGTAVIASKDISPNTTVLSCPFDLAITRDLGIGALKACIWDANTSRKKRSPQSDALFDRAEQLSERQIVCSYIVLHWVILPDQRSPGYT